MLPNLLAYVTAIHVAVGPYTLIVTVMCGLSLNIRSRPITYTSVKPNYNAHTPNLSGYIATGPIYNEDTATCGIIATIHVWAIALFKWPITAAGGISTYTCT